MSVSGFNKVAILGGGLLGGSLALALCRETGSSVSLWARRKATVEEAKAAGVAEATDDLSEALDGADLVILAVPVGAMEDLLRRSLECGLVEGVLISDVGSVKGPVHQALSPLLEGRKASFIGSHPMAGSERQGMSAGRSDLFDGAACLLTDDGGVGGDLAVKLAGFWGELGCVVHWMDSASHDALVGKVSHFPHVMAVATARVALGKPEDAGLGGGGLRDTTRVAGGDADMWSEILMENRQAVSESVKAAMDELSEMLAFLETGDHEASRKWLEEARQLRGVASKIIREKGMEGHE